MCRVFGGASTFSKMHCNYPESFPQYFTAAIGEYFVDDDNGWYFDTVSGLGSRITSFSEVRHGMMSLPSKSEYDLARKICDIIPFAEMVRFGNNGADATEGAIRFARAHTKKEFVISCGYHSCQSPFTFLTDPALGCIDGKIVGVESLEEVAKHLQIIEDHKYCSNIAAVIIEPVMLDINVKEIIKEIRERTRRLGIVLIFDEIITGMRVPKYCVANWFEVGPDMILLGKAIGGGYPLSIIAGRREIMDKPVFISYTFAGFPAAMENSLIILNAIDCQDLNIFWKNAGDFMTKFNELDFEIKLKGYNTRGVWSGPEEIKYTFWQEMLKREYFLGPAFFPRISWSIEDYNSILSAAKICIDKIKGGAKLEGRFPEPIFKRNR